MTKKIRRFFYALLSITGAGLLALLLRQYILTNRLTPAEPLPEAEVTAEAIPEEIAEPPEEPEVVAESEPEPEPAFEEYDIHILMVGDNLLHLGVIGTGKQEDGSYNFDFEFEPIQDLLDAADIAIINEEVPIAGDDRGFHGFPRFNGPTAVAQAISDAGFDVVLGATNHAYDQDKSGLIAFADLFANEYPDITLCGIRGSDYDREAALLFAEQDADGNTVLVDPSRIPIVEAGGYRFAILNYTYGPNMETFPSGLDGYLELLCPYNRSSRLLDFTHLNPQVLADIRLAEELADVTIVCPHWGTEYTPDPSRYQKEWADAMVSAGADVIIGAHPHVVQPVSYLRTENGNSALCYYSLGNFVSTQKKPRAMLEALAWVTFHVTEDGIHLALEDSGAVPMVGHYSYPPTHFERVYLLEDYTEELAAAHGIKGYGEGPVYLEKLNEWSLDLLGPYLLKADRILEKCQN